MTSPLGYKSAAPVEVAASVRLRVGSYGGRSRPVETQFFGGFRLLQPLHLDGSGQVTYILVNPGGAYFGENYRVVIEVGDDADLLFSSQGATRIYRTPAAPAVQEMTIVLGAGSRIEYVPDQIIAYRNADYRQFTTVSLGADARAFFGEIVTPGWDPDDRMFTYAGVHLRMAARHADSGRLVCVDNVRLQPAASPRAFEGLGHMEGASHMGSAVVFGSHVDDEYARRIRELVAPLTTACVGVARGVRHGISWLMVRALGTSTDQLRTLILDVNEYDRSVTTGQARMDLRRY